MLQTEVCRHSTCSTTKEHFCFFVHQTAAEFAFMTNPQGRLCFCCFGPPAHLSSNWKRNLPVLIRKTGQNNREERVYTCSERKASEGDKMPLRLMTFYAKAVRDKGSLAKEDSFIELRLPAQGIKRQGCLIAPLRSICKYQLINFMSSRIEVFLLRVQHILR